MPIERNIIKKIVIAFIVVLFIVSFKHEIYAATFVHNNKKTPIEEITIKKAHELNLPIKSFSLDSVFYSIIHNEIIPPISDNIRFTEFTEIPEEYDLWSEHTINPYNIPYNTLPDSIKIDVNGYVPPTLGRITSNYGIRRWRMHEGIDFKVNRGDSIKVAFDGTVRITRRMRGGYGIFVVVRHENGLETLYAHLSKSLVENSQQVKAGDVIGLGGSTGRSTGNHLHFELRYLGNALNPNEIIDFDNTYLTKNSVFLLTKDHFKHKKELEKVRFWTIRKGDTLGRIAMKTGVSISKLCQLNGIKRNTILRIGRKIRYT